MDRHRALLDDVQGVETRAGYDFPYWFKSLAALGCPAPGVLAAAAGRYAGISMMNPGLTTPMISVRCGRADRI